MTTTEIKVMANKMTKEQLQSFLQAIRNWEQANFREDDMMIFVDCPHLTAAELSNILDSIQPPFSFRRSFNKPESRFN